MGEWVMLVDWNSSVQIWKNDMSAPGILSIFCFAIDGYLRDVKLFRYYNK